jgi:hypothetical protein
MKQKSNLTLMGELIFKVGLSAVKSLMFAISQVVWLFAGIFLMMGLLLYFKVDTSNLKPFLTIINLFKDIWFIFFIVCWIFDFIINYKEISK